MAEPAVVNGVSCALAWNAAQCCGVDTPLASFVEYVEKPTDNKRRNGRLFRQKPGPGWGALEAGTVRT